MFHKSFCKGYNFSYSLSIYGQQMLDSAFTDIKCLSGWKKHTDFRPISFLSWQDTAIHFPFRDNSNLFAAETDPVVFRNGAGFPSHGMTVISLIIGGTIVVWSDLCTWPQAPPVWRVWVLESSVCWRVTVLKVWCNRPKWLAGKRWSEARLRPGLFWSAWSNFHSVYEHRTDLDRQFQLKADLVRSPPPWESLDRLTDSIDIRCCQFG